MVVLRLRELPDPVHERKGFRETAEDERALERIVHLVPVAGLVHGRSMPRQYDRAMVACPEPEEPGQVAAGQPVSVATRRSRPELLLEWIFRPLAAVLVTALARLRISPVAVVLANGVAGLAAAVAIASGGLVAGAVLLQFRTLLDNADGQLARVSGRSSALGRYLDTEIDLVVNAALFAALAYTTSSPVLALAAFLALTLVLSSDFDTDVLYRRARGEKVIIEPDPTSEGRVAHELARIYRLVFAPQDRALQAISTRRLERVLAGVTDKARRERATLAYYDDVTATILANLGLSTQHAMLGLCLVLGAPAVYLWLVVGFALLLPLLQVRRELSARAALR